jgi:O-antigen/teichoic acid export membrane protein
MLKFNNKNSLVRENLFFFIATNITNLLAFLFHFYMGRKLGPENYGILGVLLALIYFFSITANTIQTSIAKFISKFNIKKEYGKINFLLKSSLKRLVICGITFNIIFIIFSSFLSDFLKIPVLPLIILSFMITFEFLLPIIRGSLQGLQKFNILGLNLILEGIIKLFFGILLVINGLNVIGAVIAIILSYVIPFLIGNYNLRFIKKNNLIKINTKEIYNYTIPVLLMLISLTAFYSLDILLVKHFFTNKEAGYYSAAGLIGKMLFFGSLSISQVMFAKVSGLQSDKKQHKHLLKKSLLIIFLLTIPALLIFYLFPQLIINLLFGKEFLVIDKLILFSGIMMAIFSFIYLISFYNISLHKTKFIYLLLIFNILEIVSIYLFHDSLLQILINIIILLILLFIILLIITFKKDETKHYNSSI